MWVGGYSSEPLFLGGGGGGGGGGMEAVVMLWLLLAFWRKYLSGMLFSP